MNHMPTTLLALVTLPCLALVAACRQEEPPLVPIEAGQVIQIEFPQLPATLYTVHTGHFEPARLTARLPDNYTDVGTFPLLVFLEGGHGGTATEGELDRLRSITQDRDFIIVTMPLFKRIVDRREPHEGLMISLDDLPVLAESYRTMLDELRATIPNIDARHSVLGGFSNGAHATALLVSGQDATTLSHYRHFFFIEGGLNLTGLYKRSLRDRSFLIMVGDQGDVRERKRILETSAMLTEMAEHYRLDMRRVIMHGVGHAFPAEYEPTLREWLYRVADLPQR